MSQSPYPNEDYYKNPDAYTGATQMIGSQASANYPPDNPYAQPNYGQPSYNQPPSSAYGQPSYPVQPYGQPPSYPMQPYGQPQPLSPYDQSPLAYGGYYTPPVAPMMQRPIGVSIIAILQYIGAGLMGLVLLLLVFAGAIFTREFGALGGGLTFLVFIIFGGILIFAVLLGRGLWKLQSWAHVTTIILYGIGLLGNIASLLNGTYQSDQLVSTLISLAVVVYLLLPKTRAAFRR